ncbi:uncharacterized protein LOC131019920 [Salvia miltiorrhiza]|uniref:uncharacterized protein LOC131019920 n=1 Tax=Salvia miltiorrhiza TaxID=226208 RepID=UPI0025ABDDC4|nr:uncharacterized protein LOC131019920 [Salvia miltiorrhiza]
MRYRLRVYVADNSGGVSLSLWDRECLKLIGKPAEEIIYDPNSNELPIEIDAITNKNALFKIKVEESTIFDGAYVVTKINCDPNILNKYCGSIVESATKETQLKDKEIENIKVQNDGGSSSFTNVHESVNISDNEATKRQLEEETSTDPKLVNKRGKRVVIKKEKP